MDQCCTETVVVDMCWLQSSKSYKIGVMLCRSGQATEEEMYNNGD